jgi:GntR family transcriptional regulator
VDADDLSAQLHRSAAEPLHAQISDILRRWIEEQRFVPGDALPTEEELQRRFGVARSVVRQALAGLAAAGLIHRQRGRGSVVATPPVLRRTLQRAGGLDEQAAARGQHLATRVLSLTEAEPTAAARAAVGPGRTWRIERVRCLDDVPVAFVRTFVPIELFPHFTAELLDGSSLLSLMRDAGHVPVGGPRQVQAVAAQGEPASVLAVPNGDPLLLLEGVTQDAGGRGLEAFSVWHRANTVFDVDARVDHQASPVQVEIRRLRALANELDHALANLESGGVS